MEVLTAAIGKVQADAEAVVQAFSALQAATGAGDTAAASSASSASVAALSLLACDLPPLAAAVLMPGALDQSLLDAVVGTVAATIRYVRPRT